MLASGKNSSFDQHGHQQNGDAEIADQVVEVVERQEHRLGDEVEPAPVDQQIEMVQLELLVVAAVAGQREIDADDAGFLGAREQPRIGAAGAADRNGLRILQVVGLITNLEPVPGRGSARKRALRRAVVSGNSAAAQYLSVMPSQPFVTSNSKPRPPLPSTGASATDL